MVFGLVAWILCGVAAGMIGSGKGQGCLGFILGFLLGPFGIVFALLMKGDRKQCPLCKEYISKNSKRCPKCQADLGGDLMPSNSDSLDSETKKCSACAESIKFEANKCRFCGETFDPAIVKKEIEDRKSELRSKMAASEYVSLEGQSGDAFCLGCRQVVPKTNLLYHEETDSYYHRECIEKK